MTADASPRLAMIDRLKFGFLALGPVWTAFCGSLLLSLIALQRGTINRDGMLYVETAKVFLEDGLRAAAHIYSWPFFPILMAGVGRLTGLDYETSGYLIAILSMAGACALLVASARRLFPEAAWQVCLVLLALPAINEYRGELLREYGGWLFIMLALWLALLWAEAPRWPTAIAAQMSVCVAALFRPEALAVLPALVLWQAAEAPRGERWRRLAMIGGLAACAIAALLLVVLSGQYELGRLTKDVSRFGLGHFAGLADKFSSLLPDYGRDKAGTILFFGLLMLIPLRFMAKTGIFLVPLIWPFIGRQAGSVLARCSIFAWAFLAHLLVLGIFVLEHQYLAGRYVGLLVLYSAPLAGYGYWLLLQRFPKWGRAATLLLFAIMLGNVVSLQPPKLHFVDAGKWLAANAAANERMYVESPRAAYYAGWRYKEYRPRRDRLESGLAEGQFDLVVLEVSRKRPLDEASLSALGLETVVSFTHSNGEAVLVARPTKPR